MIAQISARIQDAVSRTLQSIVLGAGALFCLSIGLAFLTLAAWLYLISVTTSMMAALILGSVYAGIGLILLAVASSGPRRSKAKYAKRLDQPNEEAEIAKIVAAFMTGVTAGRKSRS
jgi:site-specific recombinase